MKNKRSGDDDKTDEVDLRNNKLYIYGRRDFYAVLFGIIYRARHGSYPLVF